MLQYGIASQMSETIRHIFLAGAETFTKLEEHWV